LGCGERLGVTVGKDDTEAGLGKAGGGDLPDAVRGPGDDRDAA